MLLRQADVNGHEKFIDGKFLVFSRFNKNLKGFAFFGVGKRLEIASKIKCYKHFDFMKAIERLAAAILHNG